MTEAMVTAAAILPLVRRIHENMTTLKPRVREMTEAEFYPQIERAVSAAIDQFSDAKEDRK